MNRSVRMALAFAFYFGLGTGLAYAQPARTWVSGVGDDFNPCSRTAPCVTFATAISRTAIGGEISVLDPGGFGAVSVNRSITIDGDGTLASILVGSGNGILVNGAGVVLTLRNVSLTCPVGPCLTGVQLLSGSAAVLDHVTISGFTNGVTTNAGNMMVIDSTLVRNTGVAVHAFGGSISIENSLLANNEIAVQVDTGATVNLSNNGIYNNRTGFACGAGLALGGTLATANNNRKANNTGGVVAVCASNALMTLK